MIKRKEGASGAALLLLLFYDFMILRPTLRFLMRPRPPADFAARRLAAVILPPLLFLAM